MKGNLDIGGKMVRVILGMVIIWAGVFNGSWWGILGVAPIIVALLGWCPIAAFGVLCSKTGWPKKDDIPKKGKPCCCSGQKAV
ncbi:MAG: DUF2892 domain-containing protein [Candidatus Omnitrophica bacterium]|nr:DUF2892 domain-containing protein [Candidatus Omnitrophota bacterium]MDD5671912.1 DUF2892 domain-containing protein [Candidatus Omnitrophota bacterium]